MQFHGIKSNRTADYSLIVAEIHFTASRIAKPLASGTLNKPYLFHDQRPGT